MGLMEEPAMLPVVVITPPTVKPYDQPSANPRVAFLFTAVTMVDRMSKKVPTASARMAWK
jgi:hypothetical protein